MTFRTQISMVFTSLLLLSSCGDRASSNHQETNGEKYSVDKSVLAKNHFENWKSKIIKACTLKDAFGITEILSDMDETTLDIGQLIEKNENSAIFSLGSEFIALSRKEAMSGVRTETTESSGLNVKMERTGNLCVVTLDGQEVFRTELARKVFINYHWGKREKNIPAFDAGIRIALEANEHSVALLSESLKLPKSETMRYIHFEENHQPHIFRISEKHAWNTFYANHPDAYDIEVRMIAPMLLDSSGVQINFADQGNLIFSFKLNSDPENAVDFKEYQGIKQFNQEEGLQCLNQTNLAVVSYQDMTKYCQIIQPGIMAVAQQSGLLNNLALKYFQLQNPESDSQQEFKQILKSLVLKAEDINALDPEGKSIPLKLIAQNIDLIKKAVLANAQLAPLETNLISIGFDWAFYDYGEIDTDINILLNVAADFIYPFSKSIKAIILKLEKHPTNFQAIRALNFAYLIQNKAEFKTTAIRALDLGKSKADYSVEKKLDQVFQKEVTLEQIKSWIRLLER